MASVLIVDDDAGIRSHLTRYLTEIGYATEAASDAHSALAALARARFDAVLSDVRMAGMDGLALLREIRVRHPHTGVVLMTAHAVVPDAVEAIRAGAHDYLVKPFSLEQVECVIGRLLERTQPEEKGTGPYEAVDVAPFLESRSPVMQRVLAMARRAAPSDATVLLTGESGVGKNVLAATLHRWSARARGPFVTIACTTLRDHLLESELFGQVRGAFAGAWKDRPGRLEAAAGGTAFLDEVGELPGELQPKLLRFLEERAFERVGSPETIMADTRIVAATSRELGSDVRAGRFRDDLFYRLNVIGLRVPALRERREDLPALTDHFLAGLAARHHRPGLRLTDDARHAIAAYPWPGNVRELANALERAVVLARGDCLATEDLPDQVLAPTSALPAPSLAAEQGSLADLERLHVERVLAGAPTLEEAAARLGINPTTLWRKRKRWGLE